MKNLVSNVLGILLLLVFSVFANQTNIVSINKMDNNIAVIVIDAQSHIDYGFSFPLTYEFSMPEGSSKLAVYKKHSIASAWENIESNTDNDFYNHIEVFRVDEENNKIFISVGFSSQSDSIFLRVVNILDENIDITFNQITKYYDNREAAVTSSADDMASWSQGKFETTIKNFLKYDLYITLGMNTNGMSNETYEFIQGRINTGFVEAGAHSRSHPGWADYNDYDSEITGCKNDIINGLDMPDLYRNGEREYVYTWIAPNGYVDDIIDSLVGENNYLVNRLYYSDFDGFGEWNPTTETFQPIGVTRAIDPPREELGWGIGTNDINDLNSRFDEVVSNGSVYHVMCHPNVIEWGKAYTWAHLEYISKKSNIWYVTLGHLYLYHLAQQNYVDDSVVDVENLEKIPSKLALYQNYPNPFNPTTTIRYSISNLEMSSSAFVQLKVYDILGKEISTLVSENQSPGNYEVTFDAKNLSAGIYLYKMRVNSNEIFNKMILMK